jgi:TPR repeat protein
MIARQWWEQAAAQGHAKARVNLGFLYGLGHGVPRDPVRSYMWFNLAATQSTGKIQEYSADLRDQTSQVMTHAQIAEAHQLSRQCQAQQFKGC